MATVIARKQYLAVRVVKDWFGRTRIPNFACGALFSNLTCNTNFSNKEDSENCSVPTSIKNIYKNLRPLNIYKTRSRFYYRQHNYIPAKESKMVGLVADDLGGNINSVFLELKKHPKRKFINIHDIRNSIKFLQDAGFSKQDIAESIAVCFYPRDKIKKGLEEITKNKDELAKAGIYNGFTRKRTTNFNCGFASRDKRLQLCLYYMELPFAFSGSGIFSTG